MRKHTLSSFIRGEHLLATVRLLAEAHISFPLMATYILQMSNSEGILLLLLAVDYTRQAVMINVSITASFLRIPQQVMELVSATQPIQ